MFDDKDYFSVFQPLMSLREGCPVGYEALLRSTKGIAPNVIFEKARTAKQLYELDTFSIKTAMKTFSQTSSINEKKLFINVFPSTIIHSDFLSFLEDVIHECGVLHKQIVIEINETNKEDKMWEIGVLGEQLARLRNLGIRIALDDVGKGAASLTKITEYELDFIKLDRYFCKELFLNEKKQRLISLFITYCHGRMELILEGIETEEDLNVAKSLGVSIGQGFLLGLPKRVEGESDKKASCHPPNTLVTH